VTVVEFSGVEFTAKVALTPADTLIPIGPGEGRDPMTFLTSDNSLFSEPTTERQKAFHQGQLSSQPILGHFFSLNQDSAISTTRYECLAFTLCGGDN
jgi:hypothetical protein